MVHALLRWVGSKFDRLEERWGARTLHISTLLVLVFVGALLVIELNRQALLPQTVSSRLPTNHFHAVDLALTLLLIFEVIGLVFTLAKSVSDSVGKTCPPPPKSSSRAPSGRSVTASETNLRVRFATDDQSADLVARQHEQVCSPDRRLRAGGGPTLTRTG